MFIQRIPKFKTALRHKFSRSLLGAGLSIFTAIAAQASTDVTFQIDMTSVGSPSQVLIKGSFNGWGSPDSPALTNNPTAANPNIYSQTVTITDAPGTVEQCKFYYNPGGNWESINNRQFVLGSGTQVLPLTEWNTSDWPAPTNHVTFQLDMSEQVYLGNFAPGQSVTVSGDFEGWDNGQVLTNNPALTTIASNIYTGTFNVVGIPPVTINYKFRANGGWESPASTGGNNRNTNVVDGQVLPLVFYNDAPYSPLIGSNINFSVDMSIVSITDTNFNPSSLTLNGDFNGWGSGIPMTNNPTAVNTNIYTSTQLYAQGVGSTINYQFRYTELNSGSTVYDHQNGANGGNGNHVYSVLNVPATNVISVFNDAALDDYILQPTPVLFTVDMTSAVGTDGHVFSPSSDNVYINGSFANWYAWAGGINPSPAPAGYQMIEQGLGNIYTNTIVIPPGPANLSYKYGIDIGAVNGGPADDEAGFGLNHGRVVRATALNPYTLPKDTFGQQYNEPYFSILNTAGGNLTVGAASNGKIPVQWLGRPGARLQVKSSLIGGSWQTIAATDGTNWTSGFQSTNGFVSQTNWPAAGTQFFRLVKP